METENKDIEHTLVIIKPDGISRSLTGNILAMLSHPESIIVGAKVVKVTREIAIAHYAHLKEKPFFDELIDYITGNWHANRVICLVYEGNDVIQRVRNIAGATNPEEALPNTIRGKYGRIHSKTGVFENTIHCSENKSEAEREIKLWFRPEEIVHNIYPVESKTDTLEHLYWK
ncbi:MAG: nucleoside-diphosphate kinase [Spirochaetales bacterium]|nr:nucleoside-diphosphate kinase [Spirochaetales bacterium]